MIGDSCTVYLNSPGYVEYCPLLAGSQCLNCDAEFNERRDPETTQYGDILNFCTDNCGTVSTIN